MKIFKYDLFQENGLWYANCPKGEVIRTSEVRDSYYNGVYVWAIVDPEDKDIQKREIKWIKENPTTRDKVQIGVLEDQTVWLPKNSLIKTVKDEEGKFWLYYSGDKLNPFLEKVRIIGRKTGQEIGEPVENLEYIGFCRLYIKMELGVYFFRVNE